MEWLRKGKPMRVLFTSNIPSPYVIDYLNELSNYCHVTALFELRRASDRDEAWYSNNYKFKIIYLDAIKMGEESGLSFRIIRYLTNGYNRIIIANPTTPTGIIALLYCRMRKIGFIIQSEGGFQGSGKGIKEKFKKFIMETADYYLTGMGRENDYFLMYGATKERLRWYPFTSQREYQIDKSLISDEDKNKLRNELQIKKGNMVIAVGRFIECKGFDVLLMAAVEMPDMNFYFVGGEPTSEYLSIIKGYNINNVYFVPFVDRDTLYKYYHCADLFVLPTRGDTWGLVINEAMSKGLPVITTNKCVAGIELIENGENGYIVKPDCVSEIMKAIKMVFKNDSSSLMGEKNIKKIQKYSIENMAKIVYSHIKDSEG